MHSIFYVLFTKIFKNRRHVNTCCYCFVSHGYDALKSHKYIRYDWDYVCFTDDERLLRRGRVGVWKIRQSLQNSFEPKRNSGWHKTHPEICCKGYENSVWIDANVNVKTSYLCEQIKTRNKLILTPIHNARDCIYDECDAVCHAGYEQRNIADNVLNFLIKSKMPRHYGLNETNIMFRVHNDPTVLSIDKMWWEMIQKYSKRDQLSFSYILWQHKIKPADISINNTREDKRNFRVKHHPNHHK